MANITDLFDRVSDSNTGRPIIADLASPGKAIGASSLNLTAATNWTTDSAIHFSIYETTTVGSTTVKDSSTQTDWKGTLSGTTIGNLTLTGGTDRAYTAGAKVELTPTSRYAKDLYDGIIVGHNLNGTHKAFTESSIVPTAALQDLAVTTAKLAASSVTNAKLSTTAGELGGAWLSYTPTITNLTLGNGVIENCKYTVIGKTVHFRGRVIWGTTTSASGVVLINLPVAMASSYSAETPINGTGSAFDSGNRIYPCYPMHYTGKVALAVITTVSGTNPVYTEINSDRRVSGSVPFNFADSDSFSWDISYESA